MKLESISDAVMEEISSKNVLAMTSAETQTLKANGTPRRKPQPEKQQKAHCSSAPCSASSVSTLRRGCGTETLSGQTS